MTQRNVSEAHGPVRDSTAGDPISALLADAGIAQNADLVERMVATALGMGTDRADRLDLKIATQALLEMRDAFRLFAKFRGRQKITVFGSARTRRDDELYRMARAVTSELAERGWMTVTGAGPGIMQAAAEGAGPEHAIGVSIRLPFETPNPTFTDETNLVTMKYFFTRKLMLVKESQGFVYIPGGFGTFDELFELLTLQQTGKSTPTPIVLLDRPGDGFWSGLRRLADERLIPAGVISSDDLDRVLITDSVEDAVDEITGFWRNYDSLRWVGTRLVLRLRVPPTDAEIADLARRFAFLSPDAPIRRTAPLRPELADDDRVELPRVALTPAPQQIGRLHQLIRAINDLPSASSLGWAPNTR